MNSTDDRRFMQEALDLARAGEFTARPNPVVGCLIVKNGEVLGRGLHWQAGEPHAESNALKACTTSPEGATAYVTLAPCHHQGRVGPCVSLLIAAKIARVVIATDDPNPLVAHEGIKHLRAAGISVTENVLAKEARLLNSGFFSRMRRKKPWVRAKMGMSVDGNIATQQGESQWITGSEARQEVHYWRAKSGAIITTWKTINTDDSLLTPRLSLPAFSPPTQFIPPLRVILDTQLRVAPHARIFKEPGPIWVVGSDRLSLEKRQAWLQALRGSQVTYVSLPEKEGHIDFEALLLLLGTHEINDVWMEAGAECVGACIKNQLIDELLIYMAPILLGHCARSLVQLPAIAHLRDKIEGVFTSVKQVGADIRFSVLLSEFAKNVSFD